MILVLATPFPDTLHLTPRRLFFHLTLNFNSLTLDPSGQPQRQGMTPEQLAASVAQDAPHLLVAVNELLNSYHNTLNQLHVVQEANQSMSHPSLDPTQVLTSTLEGIFHKMKPNEKRSNIPELAAPPHFDGKDPSLCRPFIASCSLHFENDPEKFKTENSKVNFVISYLRDNAFKSVIPELSKVSRPIELRSIHAFFEYLNANFGYVDEQNASVTKLQELRQTGSCRNYTVAFNNLKDITGWNEIALMNQYRKGLKNQIKDMMIGYPKPSTLHELVKLACSCDDRVYERDQEKKNENDSKSVSTSFTHNRSHKSGSFRSSPSVFNRSSPPVVSPPSTSPGSGYAPMEVDAIRFKLTDQEKQYRRDHKLCMYCGGKHKLDVCSKRPKDKPKPRQAAAISFAINPPAKDQV